MADDRPDLAAYRDQSEQFTPDEQIARRAAQMREDFASVQPPDLDKIWLGETYDAFVQGLTDCPDQRKIGLDLANEALVSVRRWAHLALTQGLDDERVREEYLTARAWFQFMGLVTSKIAEGFEVDKRQQEGAEQ